ncbi:ankyrin repeat domain-containing protein [Maricaulis sp. D1M11]|uniref:ankyrin repeat domain-containing protein n=1 Tax=Maricaulis sp. D1M11 TaxID=3076117 RepID=UPI0039B6229A
MITLFFSCVVSALVGGLFLVVWRVLDTRLPRHWIHLRQDVLGLFIVATLIVIPVFLLAVPLDQPAVTTKPPGLSSSNLTPAAPALATPLDNDVLQTRGVTALLPVLEILGMVALVLVLVGALTRGWALATDFISLNALIRQAHPLIPGPQIKLSHPVRLARHPEIAGPMTAGYFRPIILLPQDLELDARGQAILEHEIAHIRRGDVWVVLALRILDLAMWWNLPLKALIRHLDPIREQICDQIAARRTTAPMTLAHALLDQARPARHSLAPAALPDRHALKQRLDLLTLPHGREQLRTRILGLTLTLGLVVTTLTVLPRADAVPEHWRDTPRSSVFGNEGSRDATAFVEAIRARDMAELERLLENGRNPNGANGRDGSALIQAARSGQIDMVDRLLAAGARPDMPVRFNGTPLIAASHLGQEEIVLRLLAAGSDPNQYVPDDETALINAARTRSGKMEDVSALIMADRYGQTAMVDWLIARGASPLQTSPSAP